MPRLDAYVIGASCPLQLLGGHVDTISNRAAGERRRRRLHSDEFKADAVAACTQPGVSMAAVALTRGINANLLRRWVREAELRSTPKAPMIESRPPGCAGNITGSVRSTPTARVPGQGHPCGTAPRSDHDLGHVARRSRRRVRDMDAGAAALIRIDATWLAVEPVDMRARADRLLARVVQVFGAA